MGMANVVIFLKNYMRFGFKIRLVTAKSYLNVLLNSKNYEEQKIMMLRITEELISSTEDLTMWLAAINNRNHLKNIYSDIFEFLLSCWATDEQTLMILKQNARVKTAKGLLKKFEAPPLVRILEYLKTDEETLNKLLNKLIDAIKESLQNRTGSRKALLKFHNKVKHGMIIQDFGDELYIREVEHNNSKNGKRHYKRNRNLFIPYDPERAKKMVGTIEVNANAVKTIVIILMADVAYNLQRRKRKLGKKQRAYWEEAFNGV
jgi:hypothetical protein